MAIAVRTGEIESVGTDSLIWRGSETRLLVKFKDDPTFKKEDAALAFAGKEGQRAVIPVDGPFFIGMDFMPGDFEGALKTVPTYFAIESLTTL